MPDGLEFSYLHHGLLAAKRRRGESVASSFVSIVKGWINLSGIYLCHQTLDVQSGKIREDFPRTWLKLERRLDSYDASAVYFAGLRWPDGLVCLQICG